MNSAALRAVCLFRNEKNDKSTALLCALCVCSRLQMIRFFQKDINIQILIAVASAALRAVRLSRINKTSTLKNEQRCGARCEFVYLSHSLLKESALGVV